MPRSAVSRLTSWTRYAEAALKITDVEAIVLRRHELAHDLVHPRFWIDGDGMVVAVPQEPGLGITLDGEVLARYRVA